MKITKHAIDRYRQRRGKENCSDEVIEVAIRQVLYRAREVKLKPEYRTTALLCHKFEEAQYLLAGKFIFVKVNDSIITVHLNDKRKFIL